MAKVVPTVLAANPDQYSQMLERATGLSERVHVDICDGQFADGQTISLEQVHVPEGAELDLHLMVKRPEEVIETALSLHPNLIILHAESEGNLANLMQKIRSLGVKAGVAILPGTNLQQYSNLVARADHVLVFTGHLGHNGGQFQAGQLPLIGSVRAINPGAEISVDGGVTDREVSLAVIQGVDVLYVGAFLQQADDPKQAFEALMSQTEVRT